MQLVLIASSHPGTSKKQVNLLVSVSNEMGRWDLPAMYNENEQYRKRLAVVIM